MEIDQSCFCFIVLVEKSCVFGFYLWHELLQESKWANWIAVLENQWMSRFEAVSRSNWDIRRAYFTQPSRECVDVSVNKRFQHFWNSNLSKIKTMLIKWNSLALSSLVPYNSRSSRYLFQNFPSLTAFYHNLPVFLIPYLRSLIPTLLEWIGSFHLCLFWIHMD